MHARSLVDIHGDKIIIRGHIHINTPAEHVHGHPNINISIARENRIEQGAVPQQRRDALTTPHSRMLTNDQLLVECHHFPVTLAAGGWITLELILALGALEHAQKSNSE